MEQILLVREILVKFYKRFEAFILPILKFLLALFMFSAIANIGYPHATIAVFMEETPLLLNVLFALLFTVMPANMGWLLVIFSIVAQFSVNLEIAIAVMVFLLFVFIFYVRMAPKESIVIILTIMAYHFNVPFLIPILAGLYFPITVIIPITLGVFINAQISGLFGIMQHTHSAAAGMADLEIADLLTELPEAFSVVYETLMHSLTVTQDWLFIAVVFAMVVVLVHFVSRLSIDFAKEIAIGLGCLMNIFGFIVTAMIDGATVEMGMVIVMTILCGVIAWIVRCFDSILDYQRAESVQFEDDDNFYHVRIVPKVVLTKSKRVVKRIRADEDRPRQETTRRPRPAPTGHTGRLPHTEPAQGTGRLPRANPDEPPAVRRRPTREIPDAHDGEEQAYRERPRRRPIPPGEGLENMPVRRTRPAPPPQDEE